MRIFIYFTRLSSAKDFKFFPLPKMPCNQNNCFSQFGLGLLIIVDLSTTFLIMLPVANPIYR